MRTRDPIIVIGGGAAGIIAAWRAASLGAGVVLLERNAKLGIKLLISGGGKCNITHSGSIQELCDAFLPREGRFLKPSFHRFSNEDVVKLIEGQGVKTYARPNGRVFPVSGNADDVVDALRSSLRDARAEVRLHARVEGIVAENSRVIGVRVNGKNISSSHVVLSTGGASYPKTGTTGDGFGWAQTLGLEIVPIRPALAPIGIQPPLPKEWRGIALRGGMLMVFRDGKKAFEWQDDILFSHEGISGPAALEVSRVTAVEAELGRVELRFDFFPAKDFVQLDEELNLRVLSQRDRMIATILEGWLPNRLVPTLLQSVAIDPAKRGHVLTREERKRVVHLLKSWKLGDVSQINIERGEVTAGGVALGEVDPQTMRARKISGLYVCGEVLDIAGPVGGYNLQAAFSTGFVAGDLAGKDWLATDEVQS